MVFTTSFRDILLLKLLIAAFSLLYADFMHNILYYQFSINSIIQSYFLLAVESFFLNYFLIYADLCFCKKMANMKTQKWWEELHFSDDTWSATFGTTKYFNFIYCVIIFLEA